MTVRKGTIIMTLHRLPLLAGTALLALGLTACGGAGVSFGDEGVTVSDGSGAGVSVGSGGTTVTDGSGAGVTVGPDGVQATDGAGAGVSVGSDGVQATDGSGAGVSVGSDGGVQATDGSDGSGGSRQGTFGVTGRVTLGGEVTWSGPVTATCDVNSDQRTVVAELPDGYVLTVDTNGAPQSTITLDGTAGTWEADFNGDGGSVVTLTPGRTVLRGARLAGDGGTVSVEATFTC